jgi:ABC-type Fe3+-siderophore transport system permease subunit
MLHTMNGFLCVAVGFSLVYLLNRGSKNVNLSPFYLTLVAFCFSMTIGVLWEFFEFAMDQIFYLDIGIIDTMKDLLVNLVGAIVFSFIGYFTLRTSKASKVAESFMIKPNEHDEA